MHLIQVYRAIYNLKMSNYVDLVGQSNTTHLSVFLVVFLINQRFFVVLYK